MAYELYQKKSNPEVKLYIYYVLLFYWLLLFLLLFILNQNEKFIF